MASAAQHPNTTPQEINEALTTILNTTDGMNSLIQQLLDLTEAEETTAIKHPCRADEVIQDLQLRYPRAKFTVVPGVNIAMGEASFSQIAENLLSNAYRYTPENGAIHVTLSSHGKNAILTVTDTGVGVSSEHLPHLTKRFYRADEARTRKAGGTGLGLSICKAILDRHNGTIHFASKVGVGTTVTVTVPLA